MIKYYNESGIDDQGRINFRGMIEGDKNIVFYLRDDYSYILVELVDDGLDPRVPTYHIDKKGRSILPKWLRKEYSKVLIGLDDDYCGAIILKLEM